MPRKTKKSNSDFSEQQEQISLDDIGYKESAIEIPANQVEILEKFTDDDAIDILKAYREQNEDSKVSTILPAKIMYKTGDELSHFVFDENVDVINQGDTRLQIKHKERKITYDTKFSVLVDTDYLRIGDRRLTPLEKAVMDSVITFYIFGNNIISIRSIFRKLVCKKNNFNPTPAQVQLIKDCLQMLSSARISIDCTSDLQKKTNKKGFHIDTYVKRSAFLNYSEHTLRVNGTLSEVIEILDTPIILEFAKWGGQIIRIQDDILDTPVNKTTEAIIIQEYLLQQIIYFQGKADVNNIILYENIFNFLPPQETPTPNSEKAYKRKVYKCTHAILDYWTKIGLIKNYEIKNRGREKYHHLQIFINNQTPLLGPS